MNQSIRKRPIGICFLKDYPSLLEALMEVTSITKSQLKKLGLKKVKWERPLKAKEEIELDADVVNYLRISPECDNEDIHILTEDEEFIAISKPYNCHSHPLKYNDTNNVLSFLRKERGNELLKVNQEAYDRGLLYRLDYETSGLLLYCKRDFLHKECREEFSTIVEEKTYYAIVQGNFSSNSLTHKIVYTGSKKSKARAFSVSHDEGITASLEATRLAHNKDEDLTLVKVSLKEGHRHQIRVQLSAEGFPILGDELYGGKKAERLFLHCYSYQVKGKRFEDPRLPLFSLFFDLNG